MAKLISEGTIELDRGVSVYSCAAAVGKWRATDLSATALTMPQREQSLDLPLGKKPKAPFSNMPLILPLEKAS